MGTGDNPVNFFSAIAANIVKYTAGFLICSCFIARYLAQIRNSEIFT